MNKLLTKTLGLLAFGTLLVPIFASAASPVLDSANLFKVANKNVSNVWETSITASPGQTIDFMVHIHNGNIDTTASDVKVQTTLPTGLVSSFTSTATVSATDIPSVTSSVDVTLTKPSTLTYVPGSTVMYNHLNQLEANLPDGITTSGINALATLKGCWEYERWIMYKATIVAPVVPELSTVQIVKFNDENGNAVQDTNEGFLASWQFTVTGPNGYSKTVTTDAYGQFKITDLVAGHYTVTETNQDGWTNTTGLTLSGDLSAGGTVKFVFGNKKTVIPPKPTPTPVVITGKGNVPLPTTGPLDSAAGAAGLTLTGGAGYVWLRSKKTLLSALKKIK